MAFIPDVIPADRITDWTPGTYVGVPSGIDRFLVGGANDRTTIIDASAAPYNADNTGATDATAAIQAAINAAAANSVVYLPAGTYRLNSGLTVDHTRDNITIRGAGIGVTTLDPRLPAGGVVLNIGSSSDYLWTYPAVNNTVTAGGTKDSVTVTIGDATPFTVGQIIRFSLVDDATLPVLHNSGYLRSRKQLSRLVSKTATTLTFFPPLYGDYSALGAKVTTASQQTNFMGLEDLTIDRSNTTANFAINYYQCYACWMKDVELSNGANFPVAISESLHMEIRESIIGPMGNTGPGGAGLLAGGMAGSLIEDNIFLESGPSIEVNFGSCGNVFAYNFCFHTTGSGSIDTNHGPHNSMNLYEGNVMQNIMADGYFGTVSHDTLFRNWITGQNTSGPATPTVVGWCVALKRFTRNYSIAGNLIGSPGFSMAHNGMSLGYPNIGNGGFSGHAPPWADSVREGAGTMTQSGTNVTTTSAFFSAADVGRLILSRVTGGGGPITGYTSPTQITVAFNYTVTAEPYCVAPGPSGFQELDDDVEGTLIRSANYVYTTGSIGIPAGDALGGETLPESLFRTVAPAFFGALAWPPFNPEAPGTPTFGSIPAGYRYLNGIAPPVDTTAPVISALLATVQSPTSVLITWTTNEAATGQVEFGLPAFFNQLSALVTAFSTGHSILLSGLLPGTGYVFRVLSRDAALNLATSSNGVFTTPATALLPPTNLRFV